MGRAPQRWQDSADWPLTVAAVMFLAASAVPILLLYPSGSWASSAGS
jgi:hypothetical protein